MGYRASFLYRTGNSNRDTVIGERDAIFGECAAVIFNRDAARHVALGGGVVCSAAIPRSTPRR